MKTSFCLRRALFFCFLPLLVCLCAHADSWDAAQRKVDAAKTPIEKANALYGLSMTPLTFPRPTRADWERAEKALDEAFVIIDKLRADGNRLQHISGFYFQRGAFASRLGNFPEAVKFLDDAEKEGYLADNAGEKNKGSELFANRSDAKMALYDFAGALADMDKAIALTPSGYLQRDRARIHFEMGDWDATIADWKRAVALEPTLSLDNHDDDDDALNAMGLPRLPGEITTPFDERQVPFNKKVAANPNDAAPFLERAHYRVAKAKRDFSIDKITDAIAGAMFEGEGKTAKILSAALSDLDRAIVLDPKNAAAYRERGKVRGTYLSLPPAQQKREWNDAAPLADFSRALGLEPQNALTRYETGAFFLNRPQKGDPKAETTQKARENDLRSAIMNFSRAITLAPDASADAHFQRANAERGLSRPDPNTILVDYDATIAQDMKGIGDPLEAEQKKGALSVAHEVRGKILMGNGQRSAALKEFDAALALDSTNLDALFQRGQLRVIRGEYDGALSDLQAVTAARADFAEAWLFQAAARDGKGDIAGAKADLTQGLLRDEQLKARVVGSRYDAQNPTQAPLAPPPDKNDAPFAVPGTALEHKTAGNALIAKGDTDGALAEQNLALLIDPNFADALNNRGGIYREQKKFDLALADYSRAIAIDPHHRVAYLNRASLWGDLDETAKQRADLDSALEWADTPGRKVAVLSARAKARFAAHDTTGAATDLDAAKLLVADAQGWTDLANAQFFTNHFPDAAPSFRRALELDSKRSYARLYVALSLALTGDNSALDAALAAASPDEIRGAALSLRDLARGGLDSAELKALRDRLQLRQDPAPL